MLSMLKSEIKTIKKLQKLDEPSENENYREPLSMDMTTEVNIMLSWGGPSDGFKLRFDKDGELLSGVYYFQDWGTYDEIEMTQEESDSVYQLYMYGDFNSFNQHE